MTAREKERYEIAFTALFHIDEALKDRKTNPIEKHMNVVAIVERAKVQLNKPFEQEPQSESIPT